jgi:hypothetical protein
LLVPVGSRTDGHAYLAEAVRLGASGFLFLQISSLTRLQMPQVCHRRSSWRYDF